LAAVEQQVARAVGKLEQAHVDLHSQAKKARVDADTIYKIGRALDDNGASGDPSEALTKIRAALAARD
ncbi:MAG: hypothetical protein ABIR58_06760, partial [Gemmatimonadaceae bacterium]